MYVYCIYINIIIYEIQISKFVPEITKCNLNNTDPVTYDKIDFQLSLGQKIIGNIWLFTNHPKLNFYM